MKKTSTFKKAFRVVGAVVIIGLVYVFLDQRSAINEMKSACGLASEGEPIEAVIGKLNKKGYVPIRFNLEKQLVVVSTSKAFGRFNCSIEHKDGKVLSARVAIFE